MSRWTGGDHIDDVLSAADAWRERCFLSDGSLFTDSPVWTLENTKELKRRFLGNPIVGAERTFFEKLKEQLEGASAEVIWLTAEIVWFLLLFPIFSATKPETKREQIKDTWEWSGSNLPKSPYLDNKALMGVGHPGTAYLLRRHDQVGFFLEMLEKWKALPEARQIELMTSGTPWDFVAWLDNFEYSDRRPMRNVILYFLFPDVLERNLSNAHRKQIVKALKHRLPRETPAEGPCPPSDRNSIARLTDCAMVSKRSSGLQNSISTGHRFTHSGSLEPARTSATKSERHSKKP